MFHWCGIRVYVDISKVRLLLYINLFINKDSSALLIRTILKIYLFHLPIYIEGVCTWLYYPSVHGSVGITLISRYLQKFIISKHQS